MAVGDALGRIEAEGGMAFSAGEGYLVALPLDGEWVTGFGFDLADTLDAVLASDGLAGDYGGVSVMPYLDRDEARDAAAEWGAVRTLVDASAAPAPAF